MLNEIMSIIMGNTMADRAETEYTKLCILAEDSKFYGEQKAKVDAMGADERLHFLNDLAERDGIA